MANLYQAIEFKKDSAEIAIFSQHLNQMGFSHRLSEQQEKIELWVYDESHIPIAKELYQRFIHNELPKLKVEKKSSLELTAILKTYPVVLSLIIVSILGFFIVQFELIQQLSFLSFQGFSILDNNIVINAKSMAIQHILQGEIWRLLTPIFLHFDIMHITFNMTLLWFFGRQVEKVEGSFFILSHVLLIGILSNCAQFYSQPEHLFGGMSGVDYGLLGYCFLINRLNGKTIYEVPVGFFWFSMIMLGLGFLDVFSFFGYAVANIVHLLGLLTGFLLAVVFKNKKRFELAL